MSTEPHAVIERVIAAGDLKALSPADRNAYYLQVCRSVGLNPATRPLEYLNLQGKLVLYARRDAADQLRNLHKVSLRITGQKREADLFVVEVEARLPDGRTDADMGVVSINGLKGEALGNAMLKAMTKAKRRVTLSICGLGFLDETEVADVPAQQRQEWKEPEPHNPTTGEVTQLEAPKPAAPDFWARDSLAIPVNGGGWQKWQGRLARAIDVAPSLDKLDKLLADNTIGLDGLQTYSAPAYEALEAKAENARLLLQDAAAPIFPDLEAAPDEP